MSIKRLLPILIVVVVGFLTLSSHFINNEAVDKFVGEDATGWYNIIAAFAVFLGSLNLIKFQFSKIVHKKKDWNYSILTLLSFFVMIFFAFFMTGTPDSEPFEDINGNEWTWYNIFKVEPISYDLRINPIVLSNQSPCELEPKMIA